MKLEEGLRVFRQTVFVPKEDLIPNFCEIESKFQVEDESALNRNYDALVAHFKDKIIEASFKHRGVVKSIYYDDANDTLFNCGYSFRRRDLDNGSLEYAIKGRPKTTSTNLTIRLEDEVIVPKGTRVRDLPFQSPEGKKLINNFVEWWEILKDWVIEDMLQEEFIVEVSRRSFKVMENNIKLDLSFDEVVYFANGQQKSLPIHEIEVEYVSGAVSLSSIDATFKPIEEFLTQYNKDDKFFKRLKTSKADRGYRALKAWDEYPLNNLNKVK